jgi:hypothetical protein
VIYRTGEGVKEREVVELHVEMKKVVFVMHPSMSPPSSLSFKEEEKNRKRQRKTRRRPYFC